MAEQPKPAFGTGSFVWNELCTRDIKGAEDFYGKVLGWKFEPWGKPGEYHTIKAGENDVGGAMDTSKPEFAQIPPCWGYYIDVENVDETAGRVEKLGGKIMHPPTDIPEVGRFAALQDPTGAAFSVMTLNEQTKAPPRGEPGTFIWVELMSRDFDRAKAFYSELLGWKVEEVPMPDGNYTLFKTGNGNAGGGMQMPREVPAEAPSFWVGYVHVADIDKTVKEVEAAGGHVMFPPMEVPEVGRITHIADPAGAVVALMQPAQMGGA